MSLDASSIIHKHIQWTTARGPREARLQQKSGGDPLLIAECARHHLVAEVSKAIEDNIEEVEKYLECIAESHVYCIY